MKKAALFLIVIFLFACNSEINIISDSPNKYILHSFLDSDTTYQFVLLSKSFKNDEEKLEVIEKVKGARVRVFNSNEEYIFEYKYDQEYEKNNTVLYFSNTFKPKMNTTYQIEVVFKDTQMIKAETTVPRAEVSFLTFENLIPSYEYFLKKEYESYLKYSWVWFQEAYNSYLHYSRLLLHYEYKSNNKYEKRILNIPKEYKEKNGKMYAFYNEPEIFPSVIFYERTLDKMFELLFSQDSTRENYRIKNIELQIVACDKNLGRFLMTNRQALEGLSVILDNYDYTNVTNGAGIFGSMKKTSSEHNEVTYIKLNRNYLNSMRLNLQYLIR